MEIDRWSSNSYNIFADESGALNFGPPPLPPLLDPETDQPTLFLFCMKRGRRKAVRGRGGRVVDIVGAEESVPTLAEGTRFLGSLLQ